MPTVGWLAAFSDRWGCRSADEGGIFLPRKARIRTLKSASRRLLAAVPLPGLSSRPIFELDQIDAFARTVFRDLQQIDDALEA